LIKKPLTIIILSADQDIYYRHRKALFETGAQQTCELRLLRIDSPPLWVLLKATMSEDGENGKPACRVVVTDIHERKQAEEKLRIAYAELELQVQERTFQFSDANAALSVEIAEQKQAEKDLREYRGRESPLEDK
jgi:C4-dicarboxylate-specific signal transduction histidine kinase